MEIQALQQEFKNRSQSQSQSQHQNVINQYENALEERDREN